MSVRQPPSPVLCRPTLPGDRVQAFEFLKSIWEGDDYLPEVWDAWFEDPAGQMFSAEQQGRVVGVGRMLDLGWGESWLEGLRVDPRLHGRGIGSHLHDYLIDRWERGAGKAVRLATHSTRVPVHRMCQRTGFRRVAEVVKFTAPAIEGAHPFEPAGGEQVSRVLELIDASPATRALHGLIEAHWRWAEVRRERLVRLADAGGAWLWRGGAAVLALEPDWKADPPAVRLYAVGSNPVSLPRLLADARLLAAAHGVGSVLWLAPRDERIQAALHEAGFATEWQDSVFLFERLR